jgi:hypothetical protein
MANTQCLFVSAQELFESMEDKNELGHYTSIDVLVNIAQAFDKCKEGNDIILWATDAFWTNDTKETHYGYDFVMDTFSKLEEALIVPIEDKYRITIYPEDMKKSEHFKGYTIDEVKHWLMHEEATPYVISFTSAIDKTSMWKTSYGRVGKGVCLVFDFQDLSPVQNGMFILGPIKVVYNNIIEHAKEVSLFRKYVVCAYNDFCKEVACLTNFDIIIAKKIQVIEQVCNVISSFIKNEEWYDEKEYRITAIRHNIPTNEKIVINKREDGTPYVKVKIPVSNLKKIIVGPCVDQDESNRIMKASRLLGISSDNIVKSKSPLK